MAIIANRLLYQKILELLRTNLPGIKIFGDYPRHETLEGDETRISVILISMSGLSVGLCDQVSSGSSDDDVPDLLRPEQTGQLFAGTVQIDLWIKSGLKQTVGSVKMSAVTYRDYLTDTILQVFEDNWVLRDDVAGWKIAFGINDANWNPSFMQDVERVRQTIEIPVECKEYTRT